jgi:hypothetical protein
MQPAARLVPFNHRTHSRLHTDPTAHATNECLPRLRSPRRLSLHVSNKRSSRGERGTTVNAHLSRSPLCPGTIAPAYSCFRWLHQSPHEPKELLLLPPRLLVLADPAAPSDDAGGEGGCDGYEAYWQE